MPIFDNELIDSSANRDPNPQLTGAPKPFLGSPKVTDVDVTLPVHGGGSIFGSASVGDKNGLTIDQLSKLGRSARDTRGFGSPMMMVPKSELLDNQRYGTYVRGTDLENVYSLTQPWYKQLGNGVAKFAATGVGTFAQSFATIPNTVAAVKNGSLSELSGKDGYESDIDQWLKNIEDTFPNYVSRWEKENPYRSMVPFMRGSANFWGDKVIKNLGFTAGAIAGSLVQDAAVAYVTGGIGEIPLVASQIGRASLWLNKVLSGTNKLDKVLDTARALGKSEKTLANITALARAAETTKLTNGFRYGLTTYGAARTEAAVEARDGYRQVRDELINQYKAKNGGEDPSGADLDQIESYATNAMNARFGINMALLTVSNTVQFGSLFKSFTNSAKGVPGTFTRSLDDAGRIGLTEGSLDVFEKKAVKGLAPKIWDSVKPTLKNVLSEGVYEEGGQFAAEKGTYNYFTRKYKNLNDPNNKETWNTLNEVVKSTNYGLAEQFGSSEGIENMLIGGLTALVTGAITGRVEKSLGKQSDDQRLQTAVSVLNRYGLTGILKDQYTSTLNSANIAKEMEDAAKSGNLFRYKNLKHDQFFNFVNSRLSSDLHDVTVEQLNMLKDLDKAEFEKTFGMDFNESNKKTVTEYVDGLIEKANDIKDMYDSVSFTFKNPFVSHINPETQEQIDENFKFDTYNDWKTNLVYYASVAPDVNDRLDNIQDDLAKVNPLLNNDLVSSLTNRKSLKEKSSFYEETAKSLSDSITEFTTPADKKAIRDQIKTLRTLSERINIALNNNDLDVKTFESLLNFEVSGQKNATDKVIPSEKITEVYNLGADINALTQLKKSASDSYDYLSSEEGFNKFFDQAEEMGNEQEAVVEEEENKPQEEAPVLKPVEFTNKTGAVETPQIEREYQLDEEKLAKVKKIADDRYEVTSPYGDVTFFSNKEDADQAAEDMNADVEDLRKVKVIDINEDGTVKVEDLKGNIQNIDPKLLTGYEKIESAEEKLMKDKAELDRQQAELENKSATVETIPPLTPEEAKILAGTQGKLKSASRLFISGTTPTERPDEPTFIRNSREFLNNAKNFKNRANLATILVTPNQEEALGLKGLTALSYGTTDASDSTNPETGFVAQVFIEQEAGKTYFVNKNGERIGEVGKPVDIQQVIFQTMPTPSLYDRSGELRARAKELAEAEAASKAWATKRNELFAAPAFPVKPYQFAISRGVAIMNIVDGKYERNQIGDLLIPENKIATQEGLLQVVTDGFVVHNGENVTFTKGLTVLQYGDTLEIVNNNKLGSDKAEAVHLAIKTMMDKFQKTKKLDPNIVSYLQNVLFWRKTSKTSGNQIFIDTTSGQVFLGGKKYSTEELDTKKAEIVNQLKDTWHAINNTTLKNNFYEKFYEYKVENGNLIENEWPNYQSYLLSKKGRSADQTPLVTKVAKPTDAVPYSFVQKYATLIDFELPVIQAPAPAGAPKVEDTGKPVVGEFVMDGATTNTFTGFNSGPVDFTGTVDADGNISVDVIANETVEKVAKNSEIVNTVIVPTLKTAGKFDAAASDVELVTEFVALKLAAELKALQKAATFTPTTPYGTPTGAPITTATGTTPVSDIEAKKADIERRRQEELAKPFERNSENNYPINAQGKLFMPSDIAQKVYDNYAKENGYSQTFQRIGQRGGFGFGEMDTYYPNWKKEIESKINDKYDAELAALEGAKPAETYKGITVINTTDIKAATGEPGAAQYNRAENKILVNREFLKKKFDEKAWTKPRKQKDGSFATALPEDQFSTYDEFEKFVIEHEYQHSLLTKEESGAKTIGEYEDIINNRALGKESKPGTYNANETSAPEDEYMRVGVTGAGVETLTDAQIELFKQWAADKVPGIPFEVLDNLVNTYDNEKAWGVFEKGVAKFYKGAPGTTPYHEVFEGIWKGFLTPEQRQLILDEFKSKSGQFTDRASGKKINYADATDQQAKERIADDFGAFRVGKLPARTLGEKILKFFRNIIEFFKSFVQKPSMKDGLFKAIEAGKFKDMVLPDSAITTAPEYMRVPGLTETQTFEFVQDMTARAAQFIFGDSKKSLYDLKEITGAEIFNRIKEAYVKENKYQTLGDDRYNKLVIRTKESLRTLGINFNDEDTIDINDENVTGRDYAPEPFSTDWKKTSSFAIKFVTATLPQVEPTNQQNASSLSLPKRILSNIKGYTLVNFGKVFNTLLDKISNTTSVEEVGKKLSDLAKEDANYVRFFQRVGGDLSTGTIDFSTFKNEDWRLFINFFQTFTKQKPDAVIQYIDGASVYTAPANQFTASKLLQNEWFENMKALSDDPKSIIKRNRTTKTFDVDKSKLPTAVPKEPQAMVDFLTNLGIGFPLSTYVSLKDRQRKAFADAVGGIYTYIQKTPSIGTIMGKTLGINSQLAELSNLYINVTNPSQDTTYFGVENQRLQSYAENNVPSVMENEFNSVETVEELKQVRPELNDVFSKNSVTLKDGGNFYNTEGNRIKKLKIGYIQGTKNISTDKGVTTSKLNRGRRFTQEINENLNGNYYILVPADGSTEWTINLGNHVSFKDAAGGRIWTKVNTIFKGYLIDEVALALDADNRKQLKNVGDKAKQLRFFREILSDKDVKNIEGMIAQGSTQEQIEKYIDENIDSINASFAEFINDTVKETRDILIANGELSQMNENEFSYDFLQDSFVSKNDINKFKMTSEDVDNLLTFVNTNYIINNIELHKLIFGDPYEFAVKKGKLDETKRIKSFLSPRRTTFDSPAYNSFLNTEYNKAGDIELSPEDPGYHLHKSYTNTVTLADVELSSDLYPKINEADAASMIMDNTFREVKLKNGQWTTEAEAWHQWQMAYTRNKLAAKGEYTYTNDKLQKADNELISKPEPKYVTDVLKPIVSGVKAGETKIDNVLDKFSQMPLYYKAIEGTNLEKLYTKMLKENVGYVVFESGRKVGATKLFSLYNADGTFNEEPFNNFIKVPWKAYGIQVETSFENPKDQTRGSQLTKLSSLDLFAYGEGSPEAKKAYENNMKALDRLHENAYKTLLNKLGIEDLGDGFRLADPKAIQETLEYELLRREMSENAKDTIKLDENGQFIIPFEASPAYKQIKDVLFSMVNKSLISPKMNGGPKVQVPATLWENAAEGRGLVIKTETGYKKISREEYNKLSEEDKKKVKLTSDNLKFYSKGDPYIEILLPHWFRGKFSKKKFPNDEAILKYLNSTEEGKSILRGIGFRIPTQAMSSIETFRVKGFLPQSMGDTIVVPSEITAKAGSDFDIDKMNTYLKSTYIDKNGEIRLVKYQGSEEATKEFYAKVFDEVLEKQKVKKAELLEAAQILSLGLDDPNKLLDRYSNLLDVLLEDVSDSTEFEDTIMKELERLGDVNLQEKLRDRFIDDMYARSLQNEYYESLEKMITLPENFDRLVAPVDDAGLSDIATELDKLRGEDETAIKGRLLRRSFMTNLRNAFVTAKKWVGIAAVNITGQSLTQKSKVYIDSSKFEGLSDFDRKIIGDGVINLPHNTVNINGIDYPSISGKFTADDKKQFISDRLSGYATSFVDVAKDPYIMKIIGSDSVVGVFMFLERMGVGENTIWFLNQPIIKEYLSFLDSINKKGLFGKMDGEYIRAMFPTTSKELTFDPSTLKENIRKYYSGEKFTSADNAAQQAIFNEFLKYAKMAEYSFKLTQATNYDTTKFRNSDELSRKQNRTATARQKNIFSSVDKILSSSFIGKQAELIDFAMSAMGSVIKTEGDDYTVITDDVLKPFIEKEFMGGEEFNRVAGKIKASFLDYIIQTQSGLNSEIEALVVGNSSVADQLAQAKQRHPEMKILNELQVTSSDRIGGAKSIRLKASVKDAYDENMYVDMMRELKAVEPELYNGLLKIAVLQGVYQSSISIKNIMPIEDYAPLIKKTIDTLSSTEDVKNFSKGAFYKNNWKDDVIVPSVEPKFFLASEFPVYEDAAGAEIYQYYSPLFPNLEYFKINSMDRKVLLLNEKYNSENVKHDFVKIPRVVTDSKTGEKIDMVTGQTITASTFARKKAEGDMSLKDVFGYQKVKYANGEPVVTAKGEHVYKLVNLLGDGQLVSEYYLDSRPSVINNGTVKIDNEVSDADLIKFFGNQEISQQPVVPSQSMSTAEKLFNPSLPKVNIYAGTGENAELSNFAFRPFTTKDGLDFETVEGAFQAAKFQFTQDYFDNPGLRDDIILNLQEVNGARAKQIGQKIKGLNTKAWDANSSAIMKDLIKRSFEQNPDALAKLLATGNAELTHTQDKGKWGKEFPRILMEVRQELESNVSSEVRYKDKEKRIRLEYPSKIEVEGDDFVYEFNTNKLFEIQKAFSNVDDGTVSDQRKFDPEYQDYLGDYAMSDREYMFARRNQEYLRDLLAMVDIGLLDEYSKQPSDFTTFKEIIDQLLKMNVKEIDTAQLSLFDKIQPEGRPAIDNENQNSCG